MGQIWMIWERTSVRNSGTHKLGRLESYIGKVITGQNIDRIMPTFLRFLNRFTQIVRFNAHLTFEGLDDFDFKY